MCRSRDFLLSLMLKEYEKIPVSPFMKYVCIGFYKINKVIGISYRQLFPIQQQANNSSGNWQVSMLMAAVMVLVLQQMVTVHPFR